MLTMLKKHLLHLFFLSSVLLIFNVVPSYAENDKGRGHMKGKVITADGQPAAAVSVVLKGTRNAMITEENGAFAFRGLHPGAYELEASYLGYEKVTHSVPVKENETTTVTITLNTSSVNLREFTVRKVKNPYKEALTSPTLRLDAPLLEVPQNIQVVTGKVLADQQITSMSDGLIRNVSGTTRLEHWGDLYTRVNMRGSRASAFRNGMNVTSAWGPLTEDMSFVDHVEFVKGPAGFLMSNGEPSGIYNVVTKKPTGIHKGEATLTLGSYDFYRGTLDLDGKLSPSGKLLYRLNLMGQTKNSFRNYEFNNRYSIAPVISYKIDPQTILTLEYVLQHVRMSNVGTYYAFSAKDYAALPREFTVAEPGIDPTTIDDHSLMAHLQHRFNEDWKLTAQAAYFNYQQQGSSMWPGAVNPDGTMIRRVTIWDAANEGKYGQLFVNGNIRSGALQHRILAGLDAGAKEYMADWNQGFNLDSVGGYFNTNNPVYGKPANGLPVFNRNRSLRQRATGNIINQSYTGLYLQDELGFLENSIRLTLAGRYTFVKESSYGNSTSDKQFTPRIGLSVSIDAQTSVYALYDQSFVPQTGKLRGGGTVKPITGNNVEFGIKRDWLNGRWNTTAAIYRITKNNQLSPDPESAPGDNVSLQLGQTRTEGVELDIRGEIVRGLNLIANYAYTDSKIMKETKTLKAGSPVPGFAKHTANTWLNYKLPAGVLKGLGVSGGFTYMADRSTWSWGSNIDRKDLPDYFKLDGGVSWEKDHFQVSANVFNLLDTYLYSGATYATYYYWQAEPGRNLRVTVGYKF